MRRIPYNRRSIPLHSKQFNTKDCIVSSNSTRKCFGGCLQDDPPPLNWSAPVVRKQRIKDGEQATQSGVTPPGQIVPQAPAGQCMAERILRKLECPASRRTAQRLGLLRAARQPLLPRCSEIARRTGFPPAQRRKMSPARDATGPKARCPRTFLCVVFFKTTSSKVGRMAFAAALRCSL